MNRYRHLHFIGIGGIGMSALAAWAVHEKKGVSGSDAHDSAMIQALRDKGAVVHVGHRAEHVPTTADLVVYSEAIDLTTNPEIVRAEALGVPRVSYFEALGMLGPDVTSGLGQGRKTIAVSGSHGKTTTTAMLGRALVEDGFDPLVIVGSRVPDFNNSNVYIGKGSTFVVEACEYRRSFLHLNPHGLIILNCDPDHLDYYKDATDYRSAFRELAMKVPAEGFIVINAEDEGVKEVVRGVGARVIGVDTDTKRRDRSRPVPTLQMRVPGDFNRSNALMALAAAKAAGADEETVIRSLNSFTGTWRRMEVKGEWRGATVIDDYGHHPTEVRATLKALREHYPGRRLICVFQPHQYSRTYQLLEGFKTAFGSADVVIVPNIYEARDSAKDKARMSAEGFVANLAEAYLEPPGPLIRGVKCNPPSPLSQGGIMQVIFGDGLKNTVKRLETMVCKGDVIVTMGAGDVWKVAEELVR